MVKDRADCLALDLVGVVAALHAGTVSAADVTEAALARIAADDPALNAFFRVDAEAARVRARAVDQARARGRRTLLQGVPLAHKDLFFRHGQITTAGSQTRHRNAPYTATLLKRLDRAGAIDVGTLNMSEFAFHPWGANRLRPPPANPWDRARFAGASSGGSAAAVAGRLVFASLGSDSGGSIRFPAALSGIVGLMPTPGLLSRHGMALTSPTLDRPGPMARSVRDIARLLNVLAGRDPADPATVRRRVADYERGLGRALRGVRLAFAPQTLAEVDPPLRPVLARALDALRAAGARIVEIALPPALAAAQADAGTVFLFEAGRTHAAVLRRRADLLHPAIRDRLERGRAIPRGQYRDALARRGATAAAFAAHVFRRAPALVLPSAPIVAPTLAAIAGPDPALAAADPGRFTRAFNYLGAPALAVPAGLTEGGLPVGLQLIGPPFAEAMLLRIGAALERVTGFAAFVPPSAAPTARV
jgi:aspartyl-tRNA(Asn)/glutamyl-tRNA(Gln) amidotransferase subunit A